MDIMELAASMDVGWTLVAAALVFFMQAGFAMVETGFTRAKNAGNIIMKNLMDFSLGTPIFWILGFGIMFGAASPFFGGFDFFADGVVGEGYDWTTLIFQTVFCATAATIVSGSMAERTKFSAYCIYSMIISAVIYPVSGHWIWGGGWLAELGFHDFAGSTAVHMVGGVAALIGAAILGPRIGKYTKDGKARAIPGHSLTLGALGCFILWFCWFGFNGGSTVALSGGCIPCICNHQHGSCCCNCYRYVHHLDPLQEAGRFYDAERLSGRSGSYHRRLRCGYSVRFGYHRYLRRLCRCIRHRICRSEAQGR